MRSRPGSGISELAGRKRCLLIESRPANSEIPKCLTPDEAEKGVTMKLCWLGLLIGLLHSVVATTAACAADWGTLKGRFVLDGPLPDQSKLQINKDVEFCGKHEPRSEKLVVSLRIEFNWKIFEAHKKDSPRCPKGQHLSDSVSRFLLTLFRQYLIIAFVNTVGQTLVTWWKFLGRVFFGAFRTLKLHCVVKEFKNLVRERHVSSLHGPAAWYAIVPANLPVALALADPPKWANNRTHHT